MDVPIIGRRPGTSEAELQEMQIRLLICNDCKTIEEIPDYEGHPDDDYLLKISIEQRHIWPTGTEHLGNLVRVPLKYWGNDKVRDSIVKQIKAGLSGGLDDVEAGFYDTKSTFQEDAMTCFQKHLRPVGRCPDWKSDNKKLIPKTAAERKDAGMSAPGKNGAPVSYLCDFCPASIYMQKKRREVAGLYQ